MVQQYKHPSQSTLISFVRLQTRIYALFHHVVFLMQKTVDYFLARPTIGKPESVKNMSVESSFDRIHRLKNTEMATSDPGELVQDLISELYTTP